MSVTINGTSGVTTPGIANSEGYTGDGLTIATGAPAGALQIDTSGNLGLGVAPSAWQSTFGSRAIQFGSGAIYGYQTSEFDAFYNTYYDGSFKYLYTGYATQYSQGFNGTHRWFTAPSGTAGNPITFTQAMTLDASGNLLVGTSSPLFSLDSRLHVTNAGRVYTGVFNRDANGTVFLFTHSSSGGVGSISITTTGTAYATNSDYRLKENVAPLTNALDKIASLKPCSFTWKADGSADRGFIAHELQEVIPQAVSGEKDAVDAEGNIMPQGVDYGKITPEIVAAIQELKARIEQLETK